MSHPFFNICLRVGTHSSKTAILIGLLIKVRALSLAKREKKWHLNSPALSLGSFLKETPL
jgi:hypothetical protein